MQDTKYPIRVMAHKPLNLITVFQTMAKTTTTLIAFSLSFLDIVSSKKYSLVALPLSLKQKSQGPKGHWDLYFISLAHKDSNLE